MPPKLRHKPQAKHGSKPVSHRAILVANAYWSLLCEASVCALLRLCISMLLVMTLEILKDN